MEEKHGKMKPKESNGDKRGEIPPVQIFEEEENIEGKMEPERKMLQSPLAGTDLKAFGQPHLWSKDMQQTAVDGCTHTGGSSELGEMKFVQTVAGMKLDITSQVTACRKIVTLPIDSWVVNSFLYFP